MRSRVLFTFATDHLLKKDRVRFFYALKGRGQPGLVARVGAEHLGPGVLLVSQDRAAETDAFLQYWKCPVRQLRVDVEAPDEHPTAQDPQPKTHSTLSDGSAHVSSKHLKTRKPELARKKR